MSPILPPALRPGATVGVIAPSTPPRNSLLEDTISYWESRGHPVVVGDNVGRSLAGYLAGTPAERAADLNSMIADPEVELIVATMAGKGAVHLLPLIDYDAFAARPKLFMGLSDVSLLVLTLHSRTGVVTFHGPTGMDFGSLPPYSDGAMHAALTAVAPLGPLPAHGEWRVLRDGPQLKAPSSAATSARSVPSSAPPTNPTGTARSSSSRRSTPSSTTSTYPSPTSPSPASSGFRSWLWSVPPPQALSAFKPKGAGSNLVGRISHSSAE